jgi:predicted ArsR family transcriptional regulator
MSERVSPGGYRPWAATRSEVEALLRRGNPLTADQMAMRVGVDRSTVGRVIRRLIAEGVAVQCCKSRKPPTYWIEREGDGGKSA